MDIDISVLRLMEREKDLPFEVLASAIEDALLTAYEKTEGAVQGARVDLNRKTGHVDGDGARVRRRADSRSASTTTPRQASDGWPPRPPAR